ncbi:MAG TPA: YceI family protein [Terracidiphilus sp.]|nr:YceI family protein [Terracidiphilus sp.]
MTSRLLLPILLFAAALAPAQTQWSLVASTLTYHVSHPMHIVEGVSTQSRGKGVCAEGKCDFLIAAPVKSFTSGDSNRDLHMIQTVRGAQFPIVSVRTTVTAPTPDSGTIYADLEVEFAGQTVHYQRVPFSKTANGTDVRITGTVPATCSDFKIERPSFLAVAIKNEIPVTIDMTWRSQSALPGPPQQPVKR